MPLTLTVQGTCNGESEPVVITAPNGDEIIFIAKRDPRKSNEVIAIIDAPRDYSIERGSVYKKRISDRKNLSLDPITHRKHLLSKGDTKK